MSVELPEFSVEQWEFLAVLEAFGEPISIELAGGLAPLLPAPFLDLLNRGLELGWIEKAGNDCFCLGKKLTAPVKEMLQEINTSNHLTDLLDKLDALGLTKKVSQSAVASILARSGRQRDAAQLEKKIARGFYQSGDLAMAQRHLNQGINLLRPLISQPDCAAMFVSTVLEFSDISFALGQGLANLPNLLKDTLPIANRLGDRRSYALINLHRGRMFYFAEQRPKALDALAKGKNAVEDLGDNDILDRAAEFLGLYFYMQGLFPEAILHFERATLIFESLKGDVLHNLSAPFFLGYCATYLGEFNRAIGCLDCNWRLALERSNFAVAATIRAVLGTVLVVISKLREGFAHLEGAMADAVSLKNDLALYFARGGLAYGYFLEGRMADARLMLEKFIEGGTTSGIVRQYSSPWYLEMLFTLDRMGYEPLKGFTFHGEMERVMKEPNIHLHGVALRLQASLAMEKKETEARIQPMLEKSEGYLIQAGDPLQLAKTRLEMARLFLRQGDQEKARVLLKKARRGLAGDTDVFFPDELRFLLESKQSTSSDALNQSDLLQRFLTMMDQLFPNMDLETIFTRTVAATNRFFKAERGALFWLDDLSGRDLNLRAACNMTEGDIKSEDFQQYLDQIAKASNSKEPIVVRSKDAKPGHAASRAILCIPVEIQGKVKGVLYHDNSYLKDCFEELGRNQLLQLGQYVSRLVERIWNYREMTEGRNQWVTRDNMLIDSDGNQEFCAQSPKMTELLNKLESFSSSDASVLLLGETGVGKELLARRIQRLSARADGPFVIVDATSIPETLVESELFGYEKGAFTGADRRRIGRLELAHQGTLFIDEIAELSMATQTKLLRVLQEKTYTRIGGTKTRQSDFRLITATNRDLEEEILRGNFRQDLYFRINVISLTIPPLRDRPEDIELLAEHFLAYYIKKHNRFPFKLGAEDRKRLQAYQWPGNVRELKNVIERSVLLSGEGEFEMNLPTPSGTEKDHPFTDYPSMEELQRRYIQFIIDKTGGKIGGPDGAANLLGMKRTTLHARMKKLGL